MDAGKVGEIMKKLTAAARIMDTVKQDIMMTAADYSLTVEEASDMLSECADVFMKAKWLDAEFRSRLNAAIEREETDA
jgi:hypothetical protein